MDKRARVLTDALRGLGDQLKGLAHQEFTYRKVCLSYFVGDAPNGDRVEHLYLLDAVTDVFFVEQWPGVTDDASPCNALADLSFVAEAGERDTLVIQIGAPEQRRVGFRIHFVPQVRPGEQMQYSTAYRWSGAWSPLREHGRDRGLFQAPHPTEELEMRIITTKGGPQVEFESLSPAGATVGSAPLGTKQTALLAVWKDLAPGRIEYTLRSRARV